MNTKLAEDKTYRESFLRNFSINEASPANNVCDIAATTSGATNKIEEARRFDREKIRAMTRMIRNIAHVWRQPLNALAISIQDLKEANRYGDLNNEYLEDMCARSMRLINRMSKTIDDFRLMLEPNEEAMAFDVKKRIQRIEWFVADSMAANGIKLETKYINDVFVYGYPEAFSQALLNVLANAREAILESQEHKIEPFGVVSIEMKLKRRKCVVKISNNGPKIEEEHLNKVFEPYYTTREPGKGSVGLGLYAVKTVIEEAMGGEVSIASSEKLTSVEIALDIFHRE